MLEVLNGKLERVTEIVFILRRFLIILPEYLAKILGPDRDDSSIEFVGFSINFQISILIYNNTIANNFFKKLIEIIFKRKIILIL